MNTLSRYSDIEQFGREFGFWTNGNKWKCYPRWRPSEWSLFISGFVAGTQPLSTLVSAMQSFPENRKCTVDRYRSWYFALNRTCNISQCFYIEKTPIYSRTPWLPVLYANLMPMVKLITILRNPVHLVWSNVFAFKSQKSPHSKEEVDVVEKWIIEQFDQTASFQTLSGLCSAVHSEWTTLSTTTSTTTDQRHHMMMQRAYRHFVAEYLRLKFVAPRDVNERPRQHIFKWAPLLTPNLLIGLFAFEHELGIYGHFKVIQFEYIYSDTANAMSQIRCWMTGSCGADDVEKDYLFRSVDRANSAAPRNTTFTKRFESEIKRVFGPCTEVMVDVVLLIGEWINWGWDQNAF